MIVSLVKLFHLIIIVLVITSVFIPHIYLKQLTIAFLLYLLIQYLTGYEKCGLTDLEYWLMGEKYHQEGFMYRIIKPMIRVPEKYFDNYLFIFHVLWILILAYQLKKLKVW
jgi:hypothetical protein